jgi:hypothetical protein
VQHGYVNIKKCSHNVPNNVAQDCYFFVKKNQYSPALSFTLLFLKDVLCCLSIKKLTVWGTEN